MHPQLEAIVAEFRSASERLDRLVADVPAELWAQRPAPERWSASECVAHLNLTGAAFVPVLRQAIEAGRKSGGSPRRRYRRDPAGWLLWRTMGPPVRFRVRTAPAFVPTADSGVDDVAGEFRRLQAEQVACVAAADGLDLQALRIASPFDPRVRYNLYSALSILPRHQHRHLWQAEQAAESFRAAGSR